MAARKTKVLDLDSVLTFGKHKGNTVRSIVAKGDEGVAYMAYLYKNQSVETTGDLKRVLDGWRTFNPDRWDKIKVRNGELVTKNARDKFKTEFAKNNLNPNASVRGLSKERIAMRGSW